jgi:hypothetical protein
MTMPASSQASGSNGSPGLRTPLLRLLLAAVLGIAAALLVSCGASSGKLIPLANAGPLQSDFEEVAQAAQAGNGNCSGTEAAILKTEQDFAALPSTIDPGLRNTLHQGIANLHSRALVLCAQPLGGTTATTATTPAKTTTTAPSTTTTTTPSTTPTTPTTPTSTPTTPTPSGPGGGTAAPGAGEPQPEAGNGQGGGTGAGEGSPGGGSGTPGDHGGGAGGQEGGK